MNQRIAKAMKHAGEGSSPFFKTQGRCYQESKMSGLTKSSPKQFKRTRMYSSRMRTARLLTVSLHALHRGVSARGGCLPRGVSARGCLSRGCLPLVQGRGCLPTGRASGRHPPVERMTDRCKTLPCRNFVAGGKNIPL